MRGAPELQPSSVQVVDLVRHRSRDDQRAALGHQSFTYHPDTAGQENFRTLTSTSDARR